MLSVRGTGVRVVPFATVIWSQHSTRALSPTGNIRLLIHFVSGYIWTLGKTKLFPTRPYIKCFVMYLKFSLNNHMAKTYCCIRRAGNICAIVSQS